MVIGSCRSQKLPSLVLEHTIKYHRPDVRVIHTYDLGFPSPKKPELRSKTGFSFNRFAIPSLVGYFGVAAYLECDQIVFRDINELFAIPFEGATVLRTKTQTSVLLLDCNRLRWDVGEIVEGLDAGLYSYKELMDDIAIVPKGQISPSIPQEWNSLEEFIPGKTALLHYTKMDLQPWRKWWAHPLKKYWMMALQSAMLTGVISLATIESEVERGHIVPEILKEASVWDSP